MFYDGTHGHRTVREIEALEYFEALLHIFRVSLTVRRKLPINGAEHVDLYGIAHDPRFASNKRRKGVSTGQTTGHIAAEIAGTYVLLEQRSGALFSCDRIAEGSRLLGVGRHAMHPVELQTTCRESARLVEARHTHLARECDAFGHTTKDVLLCQPARRDDLPQ